MAVQRDGRPPGGELDTLGDLLRLQERMNRLFSHSLARGGAAAQPLSYRSWTPAADMVETPDAYVLAVELPGIEERLIEVVAEPGELLLRGERRLDAQRPGVFHRMERSYGRFERRFEFSETIDPKSVRGRLEDGLLRLTVPKLLRRIGQARATKG